MERNGAFHSILFPVDFSGASATTAQHVCALADLTGATVMLLHVVPWLSAWYGQSELRPVIAGDELLQKLEDSTTVALEKFRKEHLGGIQSTGRVTQGAVAETITETAAECGCDLIMMPTRGLGSTRPFLIGSTTAKVLHDARCAVWTSPHLAPARSVNAYRHILCTLDREDIPEGYVEETIRLASCFGSKLTFITAVPSCVGGYGDERHVQSLAREFPKAHLRQLNMPPDCDVLIETGSVGDVIRKAVQTHSVDLVLTNRGHIQQPFGRFRTHTYEIVLQSPCPVLSVCIQSRNQQQSDAKDRYAQRVLQPAVA